jgi:effector-binding domain-containing protein
MTYDIETRTLDEVDTAVEYATLPITELGPWLGKVYGEVAGYLARKGAGPAGPPFARFRPVGGGTFEVEAGFPASTPVGGEDEIEPSDLPAGTAAVTVHVGPYDTIEPAYGALTRWIDEHGGEPVGDAWEVYLTDPAAQPDPATWRTEIVQPYRAR